MKNKKIIAYWIATILMSFGMLGSGFSQIFMADDMLALVGSLGYPDYFLYIIGIWKVLGVIVVLLPGLKLIKEWAYAGFFFTMTGAFISHLACNHGFQELIGPFMQTIFIGFSWYLRPENRKFNISQ